MEFVNQKKMFCILHGNCRHQTKECYSLSRLKNQGFSVVRNHSFKANDSVLDEQNSNALDRKKLNKKKFNYSCSYNNFVNPFMIDVILSGVKMKALIDTGAEVSIINARKLRNNLYKDNKIKIFSASGHSLKILGSYKNLKVDIYGRNSIISPFVSLNSPDYLILGLDFITKNFSIVVEIIQKKCLCSFKILKGKNFVNNISSVNEKIECLINEHKNLFGTEVKKEFCIKNAVHYIKTNSDYPIKQNNGKIPLFWEDQIDNEIKKLLNLGVIRKSKSEWRSRIVPVKKKNGSLRLCVDFRALNNITLKDSYPIPRIDHILNSLRDSRVFTTLDATVGYFQISLDESSKHKTAFSWKNGLYEFNRMPFGLCNGPATFQRAMDDILGKFDFVCCYFDDIIIHSKDLEEHALHLSKIFKTLREAGVIVNFKKCKFAKEELKILGYIIKRNAIQPDPEKLETINKIKKPSNLKELRSFLGSLNLCREYIPHFSEKTHYLYKLLCNKRSDSVSAIEWTKNASKQFENIKNVIKNEMIRYQPDLSLKFILTTDASDKAIGATLTQRDSEGRELLISVFSKSLNKSQLNYSTTDKELLAIVEATDYFKQFLLGKKFTLNTDHKALKYLKESKNLNSRMLRWSLKLQDFDFDIEYIPGKNNCADYYSRIGVSVVSSNVNTKINVLNNQDKQEILKEYHASLGHGSVVNMFFNIRSKFFWKNMYNDIKNFIKNCEICLKSGSAQINTKHKIIQTSKEGELWQVDLIGYLDKTIQGNKYILVGIDHYTKWVESIAVADKNSKTIADAIKKIIIDKHNVPNFIMSDNGLEFKNIHIKNLLDKYNFKWIYNSPTNHASVGGIERTNQTLMNKIKKLCKFGHYDWDTVLKNATDAYNKSYNRSIGVSPYILTHKKLPMFTIDKKFNISEKNFTQNYLIKKRNEHFDQYSKKHIQRGKRSCFNNFKLGDKVLVFRKVLGDKLKNHWSDGYKITGLVNEDSYIVESKDSKLRANKKHLKLDTRSSEEGVSI